MYLINEKTADAIVGLHQPLMLLYGVNQFIADDLFCSVGDVIHPPNPLYLICFFELFGDAFFFGELFDQAIIHLGCILVDVGKVIVEFALGQQVVIQDSVMILQIVSARCPQTPISLSSCSGNLRSGRL